MASGGLRIGIVGATGALGSELIEALAASSIRVAAIVPIATERSLGTTIEFQGGEYPVETDAGSLDGLDFVFLCAPRTASLEAARRALRAEVPGVDLSGALAPTREVPLHVAALGYPPEEQASPFVATPTAPALALTQVLHPLADVAGLTRVVGTLLDSASVAGVRGIESLMSESLALFNQQEAPDPTVFSRPVAFDCGPAAGPRGEWEEAPREQETVRDLARLLGADVRFGITAVQVPTFLGLAASILVETRDPLAAEEARAVLAKAPGVEVWPDAAGGPSLRATAGRAEVLVGRIRVDPTSERGLLLWVASDPATLVAANAIELAEARLGAR